MTSLDFLDEYAYLIGRLLKLVDPTGAGIAIPEMISRLKESKMVNDEIESSLKVLTNLRHQIMSARSLNSVSMPNDIVNVLDVVKKHFQV